MAGLGRRGHRPRQVGADEAAGGCKPNDHADANYQAASTPDLEATNDKTAFVSMWNAIAAKYGLTRYETSQL